MPARGTRCARPDRGGVLLLYTSTLHLKTISTKLRTMKGGYSNTPRWNNSLLLSRVCHAR